jgi:hypothetical protein
VYQHSSNQAPYHSRILMKVRILESLVGNDPDTKQSFSYGKGQEVDMPTNRALSLVRGGLAIALQEEQPKVERAAGLPPTNEKRKK